MDTTSSTTWTLVPADSSSPSTVAAAADTVDWAVGALGNHSLESVESAGRSNRSLASVAVAEEGLLLPEQGRFRRTIRMVVTAPWRPIPIDSYFQPEEPELESLP